jgi:hypothetical protein
MSGPDNDSHVGRAPIDPAEQRQRLADLAAAIATTEDAIADTLERMALVRQHDATGLRARAAQARENAALGRNRAAAFNLPARGIPVPDPGRWMGG